MIVDSNSIPTMLSSVFTPIFVTTVVFITIQTPILQIYREIRGSTVNTIPVQVSSACRALGSGMVWKGSSIYFPLPAQV